MASAAVCSIVVDSLFLVALIVCGGVVFVPYFVMQCLVSFTINLTILTHLVSEWQDSTRQTPWDHQ